MCRVKQFPRAVGFRGVDSLRVPPTLSKLVDIRQQRFRKIRAGLFEPMGTRQPAVKQVADSL